MNIMKNTDFITENFREMSGDEKFACTGGGFAYDVGRFIRFAIISGPSGLFVPCALLDACAVQ